MLRRVKWGILGLDLGEDTSVTINNGVIKVCGSRLIITVDGTSIDYTDLTEFRDGQPITVERIKVHVLEKGRKFLISARTYESR